MQDAEEGIKVDAGDDAEGWQAAAREALLKMLGGKVRTTVTLAAELLAAIDLAVREGAAGNRSDFLDLAVRNQLAAEQRARIDAQFARMACDSAYRQEAQEIAGEFGEADREALRLAGQGEIFN